MNDLLKRAKKLEEEMSKRLRCGERHEVGLRTFREFKSNVT